MYALTALALYAALILVNGVVRVLIARARTGDTGIRRFRTTSSPWAGLAPAGSLGPGLAAPLAELSGLPAIGLLDHPGTRTAGAVLAAASITAVFAAQLAMGPSWRIGIDEAERTRLVTTGPFALVRNPILTGVVAATAGLAVLVPNALSLAGLALVVLGVQLEVRPVEEPYLRRTHGAAYLHYAARTGRFLPRIGRIRHDATPEDHR